MAFGEVVFNTSMTGYQCEVLTDPSYLGQIVTTLTCPEIGNYGVTDDDVESRAVRVAGFVLRDGIAVAKRATGARKNRFAATSRAMASSRFPTSTRARSRACWAIGGTSCAASSPPDPSTPTTWSTRPEAFHEWKGPDLVKDATCASAFDWAPPAHDDFRITTPTPGRRPRRVVRPIDFGMKRNILRRLPAHGCEVRVFPATTPAAEVLATRPDGVFLQ